MVTIIILTLTMVVFIITVIITPEGEDGDSHGLGD